MRLGISHVLPHEDAKDFARVQREAGLSAVVFPVDYKADANTVADYADACQDSKLLIAEVGAWCNPISEIAAQREASLERCIGQLRLAEEIGAKCCVNVAGAYRGKRWDTYHPLNLTQEAFDATVACVQSIIDTVNPKHTKYCLEAMPWMVPTSPQEYIKLIQAVDREAFSVHIDVTNWVFTLEHYFNSAAFIDEIFDLLGTQAQSCHLKDNRLSEEMTFQFYEVPVGTGGLDVAHYMERAEAVSPEMPMILEHLTGDQAYYDAIKRTYEIAKAHNITIR